MLALTPSPAGISWKITSGVSCLDIKGLSMGNPEQNSFSTAKNMTDFWAMDRVLHACTMSADVLLKTPGDRRLSSVGHPFTASSP